MSKTKRSLKDCLHPTGTRLLKILAKMPGRTKPLPTRSTVRPHTPWYTDPFETGFDRARSPSPAPIASTSSHAVAPPLSDLSIPHANPVPEKTHKEARYQPYRAKPKKASAGPAKIDLEKEEF
ncbi:hypothetical protein DFH09DRAFT_1074773 [Mycena vulgaris]|nr:hypothetical protein DFH09DRAFT_1106459 [Mycena vulgaris]KAJ6587545.1 hypothetical protein DFH09DRAFT_1074773 [Mycena vulgaris]